MDSSIDLTLRMVGRFARTTVREARAVEELHSGGLTLLDTSYTGRLRAWLQPQARRDGRQWRGFRMLAETF